MHIFFFFWRGGEGVQGKLIWSYRELAATGLLLVEDALNDINSIQQEIMTLF